MDHDQRISVRQDDLSLLPDRFYNWFQKKGWSLRPHQAELLKRSQSGQSTLLIAPTGAGKTLAGFLPSMVALSRTKHHQHLQIVQRVPQRHFQFHFAIVQCQHYAF